jgi:hypothetical protein
MWPWKPTTIPLNEDHPRLGYGTLRRAGGLNPGAVTYWGWNTAVLAPSIKVTGSNSGFFTITDEGLDVKVILRGRWLICPSCERLCQYLLRRDGWHCRQCAGVDYAVRHRYRTARRPVVSLNKERDQLRAIDRVIRARLERYGRAGSTDPRRGRGDGS